MPVQFLHCTFVAAFLEIALGLFEIIDTRVCEAATLNPTLIDTRVITVNDSYKHLSLNNFREILHVVDLQSASIRKEKCITFSL